jgi:hypothetical protein
MKKGDLMMVGTNPGWGEDGVKKGDLVVVVEPNGGDRVWSGARVAQVLHPIVGVCYIRKQQLEAVNESR